jgi:hypothetical protein
MIPVISPREIEVQSSELWKWNLALPQMEYYVTPMVSCYTYAPVISPREIGVQSSELWKWNLALPQMEYYVTPMVSCYTYDTRILNYGSGIWLCIR